MTAPGTEVVEREVAAGLEDVPAEVREFIPASVPAEDQEVKAEVAAALKGFSMPKRWVAEVTDITLLPDFLPDGTPLKEVVMSALTAHMHAVRKATGKPPEMPGAEFKQVAGSSVRT
jgi:hypothetical protein